jgi:hypothetical protein
MEQQAKMDYKITNSQTVYELLNFFICVCVYNIASKHNKTSHIQIVLEELQATM